VSFCWLHCACFAVLPRRALLVWRPLRSTLSSAHSLSKLLPPTSKCAISTPPPLFFAPRCAAFAKRLLQVCADAPPSWAAGALLLISEVLRAQPALWSGVQQPEEGADDEERFVDVDVSSDDDEAGDGEEEGAKGKAAGAAARREKERARAAAKAARGGGEAVAPWPREGGYDMRKR
jgi:hypothetical protein